MKVYALFALTFASLSLAAPVLESPVADRAVAVDLGGAALELKRGAEEGRALDVDLAGGSLAVKRGTVERSSSSAPVTDLLANICDPLKGAKVVGTALGEVCETETGTNISVAAADGGLAKVTISGNGLLTGSSITVPVEKLSSVIASLGF